MQPFSQPHLPDSLTLMGNLKKALSQDEKLWGFKATNQDLSRTRVIAANISDARLVKINFSEANLEKFGIMDVVFSRCDLTATNCAEASWHRVKISGSRLSGLKLQTSSLRDVIFDTCKLDLANFRFSKLKNVLFKNCVLDEADFYNTELENVQFQYCSLIKTEFSSAKCKKLDLRTSDISSILGIESLAGAIIDSMQLIALAPMLAQSFKIKIEDD